MIHSIELLTKALKVAKSNLKRAKKQHLERTIGDLQYHSIKEGLSNKIAELKSDIETLKIKHKIK